VTTDRWDNEEEPGVSERPAEVQRPVTPDDDQLLAVLRRALPARRAVPPEVVHAAKNTFAWHDIDAELAQLTYDSSRATGTAAATRAEPASIRALIFTSPHLTIELEVTADALLGQITPMQVATILVQIRDADANAITSDDIGCFSIRPVPADAFRLRCVAPPGIDVLTSWITI
jgi:hypothetical protein